MYVVVDEREIVTDGYVAGFNREGLPSLGFNAGDFRDWLTTTSEPDLGCIQGFLLGDFDERVSCADMIRTHCRAPIIALNETRSLEQTLQLFMSGIDDVVRKPVHVREILARVDAIWRRINAHTAAEPSRQGIHVFFDGRDPEIDGEKFVLPRRERHILEYLVRNRGRRVSKAQIFNAIYGIFNENVEENVIEGHMSKLRKKLRMRLGHDPIEAKRYLGYTYVG